MPDAKSFELSWQVTQDDIDHGEREDCDKCPVARAINRVLPGFLADVTSGWIVLWEYTTDGRGNLWPVRQAFRARTPSNAETFIEDFDDDEPVGPIWVTATFELVTQP